MKKEPKFYICKHCGNVVTFIKESGAPLTCCGDLMTEIIPNAVEASVVALEGNTVSVVIGSVEHPMLPEHFIQWIYLETEKGFQMKYLAPGEKPEALFELSGDKVIAVYEYCNLHGLWKTVI